MLYCTNKDKVIIEHIEIADNFWRRFMGLMGRPSMGHSYGMGHSCGMLFEGCNSIHMFFMRFAIDVVFMDKTGAVIYLRESLKPWQIIGYIKNAYFTVEMPEGTISSARIEIGDILKIK